MVSDRGCVRGMFVLLRAPAGKYPAPPHVISCPHRGYFGLFASRPRAWWAVVGPCGYGVGEGSVLPLLSLPMLVAEAILFRAMMINRG